MAKGKFVYDGKTLEIPRITAFKVTPENERDDHFTCGGYYESVHIDEWDTIDITIRELTKAQAYEFYSWWSWAKLGMSFSFAFDSDKDQAVILNGDANSGQKVVPLISTTGFATGDYCKIRQAKSVGDWYEVAQIASITCAASVTVEDNLLESYQDGDIFKHIYHWPNVVLDQNSIDLFKDGLPGRHEALVVSMTETEVGEEIGDYLAHAVGVSTAGVAWSSRDYSAWEKVTFSSTGAQYHDVAISDAGRYVFFGTTYALVSDDYGETYTEKSLATLGHVDGLDCSADGRYVLAANSGVTGAMNLSTDYGVSFSEIDPAGDGNPHDWISAVIGGAYWLVGQNSGPLYLSTDYGSSWANTGLGNKYWIDGCASTDGSLLIAASSSWISGRVYYSSDGGSNWTAVNPAAGDGCVGIASPAVACSADGKYVLCSTTYSGASYPDSGYTYLSTDYGVSWVRTSIPKPDATSAAGVYPSVSPSGRYMLVGRKSLGVAFSEDYGSTWSYFDPTCGSLSYHTLVAE